MKNKKRIFVTGGSGFLGWNLIHFLAEKYDLWCIRNTSPLPNDVRLNTVPLDLKKTDSIYKALSDVHPDVVVHLAAVSRTDTCRKNPELAEQINIRATKEILKSLLPKQTRFIYISTDLVFNGIKGNYKEDVEPNPKMVYGETKLHAESLVRSWGENHVILRLALMYGKGSPSHKSFINWMEKGLSEGRVHLFSDEFRTPLYVNDAVVGIFRLLETDFCGTMHLGGSQRCSRYDFGLEFCRQTGMDKNAIIKISQKEAGSDMYRPPDVSLDSSLAKKILKLRTKNIREGIRDYLYEKRNI